MLLRQTPLHNGTHGMQYIFAGKVIAQRDLGLSRRLFISLPLHDFRAGVPKLNARIGMDAVVNAIIAGLIAPGHAGIGSIDNSVTAERRDVPLSEIDARFDGR